MGRNHHLAKVRVDYILGAKWLLRVQLPPDRTSAFRRLPAICTAASGSVVSYCSPMNVIVAKVGNERHYIARARRSDVSTGPWPLSDSVPACLYVSLSRGKERDREGA
jgi:hypothetical protein